jgi:hypothetical protein
MQCSERELSLRVVRHLPLTRESGVIAVRVRAGVG